MPLVFAGITPHTPLLLPNVGKEAYLELKKTRDGLLRLEQELYAARPQVIILFSSHTRHDHASFTIHVHPKLVSHFETFGDLVTKHEWVGASTLATTIAHHGKKEFDIQASGDDLVDHGISVPLTYLTEHQKDVAILPIGPSGGSRESHVAFGAFLKEEIHADNRRIAVLASADLSHRLDKNGPRGFHADGARFDEAAKHALKTGDPSHLLSLSEDTVTQADECGLETILLLLGVLSHTQYRFESYSYEFPFGIGYLTGQCVV